MEPFSGKAMFVMSEYEDGCHGLKNQRSGWPGLPRNNGSVVFEAAHRIAVALADVAPEHAGGGVTQVAVPRIVRTVL